MLKHEILVLRHGETEWNRAGRLQGNLDSPLTDLGCEQARDQAAILAGLELAGFRFFCSPLGRTIATSRIVTADEDWQQDVRLAEIDIGDWTGWTRAEIEHSAPAVFEQDHPLYWYDHAPGGEGFEGLEARCRDFLSTLDGPAVLMTHGVTSRFLRAIAAGRPARDFTQMGGGQGIVYRVAAGRQTLLRRSD